MTQTRILNPFKDCSTPILGVCLLVIFNGCSDGLSSKYANINNINLKKMDSAISCHSNVPNRYSGTAGVQRMSTQKKFSREEMARIPAGTFMMGADDNQADADEYPKHKVSVDAFLMDEHEVTNAQFELFVKATGYVTTAEQKPDWEVLKKQLPSNTGFRCVKSLYLKTY